MGPVLATVSATATATAATAADAEQLAVGIAIIASEVVYRSTKRSTSGHG